MVSRQAILISHALRSRPLTEGQVVIASENGPLEKVPLLVASPPHSQHESTDPKQVKTRGRILQSSIQPTLQIKVDKNHDFFKAKNQIYLILIRNLGLFLENNSKPVQKVNKYCFTLNQESYMNNCMWTPEGRN